MNNTLTKQCFYVPGQTSIIDIIGDDGKSFYQHETLKQIQKRYPGAQLMDFGKAIDCIDREAVKNFNLYESKEIKEDQYYEMLECLPPMKYTTTEEGTSFMISERTFADITAAYVHKNNKYYCLNVRVYATHQQILNFCN